MRFEIPFAKVLYYMQRISIALLCGVLFLIPMSCGQVENTNSTDAINYSIPAGSAKFSDASKVLRKYCIQCHTFAGYSETALLTSRAQSGSVYVQPRSLETSVIYTKIRGNLTETTGNMPPNGSVPSAELVKIQDWILSL